MRTASNAKFFAESAVPSSTGGSFAVSFTVKLSENKNENRFERFLLFQREQTDRRIVAFVKKQNVFDFLKRSKRKTKIHFEFDSLSRENLHRR